MCLCSDKDPTLQTPHCVCANILGEKLNAIAISVVIIVVWYSYSAWMNFVPFALIYWLKNLNEHLMYSYNSFVECLPRAHAQLISSILDPFTLSLVLPPISVLLARINQCTLALTHTKTILHIHGRWKRPHHFAYSPSVFTSCLFTIQLGHAQHQWTFPNWTVCTFSTSSHRCVLRVPSYMSTFTVTYTLVTSKVEISALNCFQIIFHT